MQSHLSGHKMFTKNSNDLYQSYGKTRPAVKNVDKIRSFSVNFQFGDFGGMLMISLFLPLIPYLSFINGLMDKAFLSGLRVESIQETSLYTYA